MTVEEVDTPEDEFTDEEAMKEAARIYFKLWPLIIGEPTGPTLAAAGLLLVELARANEYEKKDLHELIDDVYDRTAALDLEQGTTSKGGDA